MLKAEENIGGIKNFMNKYAIKNKINNLYYRLSYGEFKHVVINVADAKVFKNEKSAQKVLDKLKCKEKYEIVEV